MPTPTEVNVSTERPVSTPDPVGLRVGDEEWWPDLPEEVERYTRIRDCEGQPLFENDVVLSMHHEHGTHPETGEDLPRWTALVCWREQDGRYVLWNRKTQFYIPLSPRAIDRRQWVKIGHIRHEGPLLIDYDELPDYTVSEGVNPYPSDAG